MVIWNVYIIVVLTISMYYTTLRLFNFLHIYRLAFPINSQRHENNLGEIFFDLIPNISFMVEILLKLNTCYYERGHLIKERIKIVRYYFNTSIKIFYVRLLTRHNRGTSFFCNFYNQPVLL